MAQAEYTLCTKRTELYIKHDWTAGAALERVAQRSLSQLPIHKRVLCGDLQHCITKSKPSFYQPAPWQETRLLAALPGRQYLVDKKVTFPTTPMKWHDLVSGFSGRDSLLPKECLVLRLRTTEVHLEQAVCTNGQMKQKSMH